MDPVARAEQLCGAGLRAVARGANGQRRRRYHEALVAAEKARLVLEGAAPGDAARVARVEERMRGVRVLGRRGLREDRRVVLETDAALKQQGVVRRRAETRNAKRAASHRAKGVGAALTSATSPLPSPGLSSVRDASEAESVSLGPPPVAVSPARSQGRAAEAVALLLARAVACGNLGKHGEAVAALRAALQTVEDEDRKGFHIASVAAVAGLPVPEPPAAARWRPAVLYNLAVQHEALRDVADARRLYELAFAAAEDHADATIAERAAAALVATAPRPTATRALRIHAAYEYFMPMEKPTAATLAPEAELKALMRLRGAAAAPYGHKQA